MVTRRDIFIIAACTLGILCGVIARPAAAADPSVTAFVTKIYDSYKGKNGNGVPLENTATIQRYFEPSLAAMIIKDQKDAARRKDAPTLDGDPFVDAQDWDIAAFDIAVTDEAPGKAVATVSFKNGDQPTKIVLNLVTVKNEWRIADITWQHDGKPETLRGLYHH
jgi:hypothetical protein